MFKIHVAIDLREVGVQRAIQRVQCDYWCQEPPRMECIIRAHTRARDILERMAGHNKV